MKLLSLLAATGAVLATALPAAAASYTGFAKVPSVAWISQGAPCVSNDAAVRQTSKAFVPNVVVVTVGSAVRFPNDDNYFHSVYSESTGNAFDLGLYDTGPGKTITTTAAGVIDVRCHVHGSMHATIVVVDGPFARTTEADQNFRIDGVTPGAKTLHVWSGGADVKTTAIVVR